ncbi:hypothetical protein A2U01_0080135, partial [Trifolium medium]|nr:hypothetical protein [Trifolium medium]
MAMANEQKTAALESGGTLVGA